MNPQSKSSRRIISFTNSLNSAWRLALIALIVFGVAFVVGYTATAAAPGVLHRVVSNVRESTDSHSTSQRATTKGLVVRHSNRDLNQPLSSNSLIQIFEAKVTTDKPDYSPGQTAIITGSGFWPNEIVTLQVVHIDGGEEGSAGHEPWNVAADGDGNFTTSWFVNPDDSLGATFLLTAVGNASGLTAQTTFTDKPAANLDQCANGGVNGPFVQCAGAAWQNGNLNGNQAHYLEGQTVPYRAVFSDLTAGATYTTTIQFDSTQDGKHATDYLMTFNATEGTADPCTGSGAPTCVGPTTFPIPLDPSVSLAGVIQQGGQNFTMYNGTITGVSAYTLTGTYAGTSKTSITVTFTATASGIAVIAWGGHISTRIDWGVGNSAIAIDGAPYHMRLIDFTCSNVTNCGVGNQDRSLSAGAIFFPAILNITKVTDPTPQQTAKLFSYTGTGTNLSNFSLDDDPNTAGTPNTKSFSLTDTSLRTIVEADPGPEFDLTNLVCNQIPDPQLNNTGTVNTNVGTGTVTVTPAEGETINCTYTNTENFEVTRGKIKIVKETIPDGSSQSFTFTPNYKLGFSLTDGQSNTSDFLVPSAGGGGPYTISEGAVAGWTSDGGVCTNGTPNNITVVAGQTTTCTFTNTETPKLTVIKHVVNDNGGSAVAGDFTMNVTATNPSSSSFPGAEAPGTTITLDAGTYSVAETGPSGYAESKSADCSGSIAPGDHKTCTITNNDIAPKLHLRKVVTNDNGGTATVADFTLTANGTGSNDLSGTSPVDSGGTLQADTWALSETSVSGYSASAWVCVGGTQNGSNITVGIGGEATCTITNDDVAPKLHLRKVVTNDNGGTATVADFTLTADGTGANDLSGTSPVDSGATLQADTWALSETTVSGYSASAWVCVGGTQNGSNITVGIGGEATCTITNDDVAPKLHLRKVVTNNNGGTATVADFTLTANGTGSNDLSGTSPVDSGATLQADTWALSETSVSGYAASAWVCVGGTQNGSNITVGIGGEATCTITNNDIAPKLHLRKYVVNDNGGTATVANFTLTADGTGSNDLSGTSPVDSGATLQADTWALSETTVNGYAASAWVCVGGTQNGSNITVGIGGEATCTITNNDIAPQLHLRKVVINDQGGTKTVADFTLTANGTGSNDLSGTSPVDSGAGLKADTWALSETNVYGYTASAWVCVGGTQNGSNITLGVGGEATCTITNNDQPGTIIIEKLIKPVGSLTSFTFQTTGTGYSGFSLSGGQSDTQNLSAGNYTAKELVPLGWVLTGIGGSTDTNTPFNCIVTGTGGSTGVGDLNTQTASISLKNGDTVKCVFENTGQGVTRTQGFWATHPQLANIAWFGGTQFGHTFPGVASVAGIGDVTLCTPVTKNINTLARLMGGFWSDVSKTTTGVKRSATDQARMQLLQQLLAAELNASAFGSVPSSGTFAQWESAYCSGNANQIKTAQQQAASFNSAGDSGQFTPGTSADSKGARAIADLAFWNILP